MKTVPRRFPVIQIIRQMVITAPLFFVAMDLRGDGCFVAPKFVWDKHKDINEPTQKAIIAYDAGQEDLILQVKYDGPVEEFGWVIPVPNLPTVTEGSMECFYELSQFTQRKFEFEPRTKSMSAHINGGLSFEPEPPVKVIQIKTVGAYQVTVLSAKDAGALEKWLNENQFSFPPDQTGVIDSYIKHGWYFVAARIDVSKPTSFNLSLGAPKAAENTKGALAEKLSSGELHPLRLTFASSKCVFPLKISSVGGKPSEVQLYVLSVEPLVEGKLFEEKLAENQRWRTDMMAKRKAFAEEMQTRRSRVGGDRVPLPRMPEPDEQLSNRGMINEQELLPYAQAGRKDLPECSHRILLPGDKEVWLTKITRTFKAEEMRDLEFMPAIPQFAAHLGDSEGALAAAELARLGTEGDSALLTGMKSSDPAIRAHATAVFASLPRAEMVSRFGGKLDELLPGLLKDSDPEVRLHAMDAARSREDGKFFSAALELLHDDYEEVSSAARRYVRDNRDEAQKHIPLFHAMLKDTNAAVQVAGLQTLFNMGIEVPREELLPLFSVPRMEAAAVAFQILQPKGISCEEAKPLLKNSLGMARLLGLRVLGENANQDSVEFTIPLLKDSEPFVRTRAHALLVDMTGQKFAMEQPAEWERWWQANKATFVLDKEQMAQRQAERRRQMRDEVMRRNAEEEARPARSGVNP